MIRSRILPALLTLAVLLGTTSAIGAHARSGEPSAPRPAVGVTLSTGPGGETQAFNLFLNAGSTAIEAPQPWSTLEPAPGRFALQDVSAIVQGLRSIPAMQIMLIPAAVETTQRSVPGELQRVRWGGRRMINRYRRLLRHLAPSLDRQVRFISIANEADVYFSAHRGELAGFLRFARAEIAALHRLAPWAKVGVTVTYSGLSSTNPGIAMRLGRLGDVSLLTYYPLSGGYRMRSPRAPLHDIPKMVRLAHGRPLVLQEVGYSSSPRLGGSPSAQAKFVQNVFAASDRFPSAIPFLSFYTLFDLAASQCRSHSNDVTFFCSLGLRYRNGRAKPSWAAFRSGIRQTAGTK